MSVYFNKTIHKPLCYLREGVMTCRQCKWTKRRGYGLCNTRLLLLHA